MNLKEIKDAARKAFSDQQTQDTEGGVPDGISFIAGFVDGVWHIQNAYETLQAHDEMLIATVDKLKEKNKKLRDALEYYASDHSWEGREIDGDDWHDFYEDGNGIGGKLARQVLKEVGEE